MTLWTYTNLTDMTIASWRAGERWAEHDDRFTECETTPVLPPLDLGAMGQFVERADASKSVTRSDRW